MKLLESTADSCSKCVCASSTIVPEVQTAIMELLQSTADLSVTAIVEGLAQRMVNRDVPMSLMGVKEQPTMSPKYRLRSTCVHCKKHCYSTSTNSAAHCIRCGASYDVLCPHTQKCHVACQILELDLGALTAGCMMPGEFEERLKQVLNELAELRGRVVLFIDDIHNLVPAGGAQLVVLGWHHLIHKPPTATSDIDW
eukprot:1158529-Pelagomonas_calceolata.AAC.6